MVALVAEAATGKPYTRLLAREVMRPLGLRNTELPRGFQVPKPLIHGYDVLPQVEEVTECCAMDFVGASGGIYSTPHESRRLHPRLRRRRALRRRREGGAVQLRPRRRIRAARARQSVRRPGAVSVRTGCGTVFGHTGNFPGYTQFTAATRNGRRSVTVSVNRQLAPDATGERAPKVFETLHRDYRLAVCALLG